MIQQLRLKAGCSPASERQPPSIKMQKCVGLGPFLARHGKGAMLEVNTVVDAFSTQLCGSFHWYIWHVKTENEGRSGSSKYMLDGILMAS